jgi:hypothetical protein
MKNLTIDLDSFAFSRRETNWSILTEESGGKPVESISLRYIYGARSARLYDISLFSEGGDQPFHVKAHPSLLQLESPEGSIDIIMPRPRELRIRSTGVSARFTIPGETGGMWEAILPVGRGKENAVRQWRCVAGMIKHDVRLLRGSLVMEGEWGPRPSGARRHQQTHNYGFVLPPSSEICIQDYRSENTLPHPARSFDADGKKVLAELEAWHAAGPEVSPQYKETAQRASYITWSSFVPASGNFWTPTMLMSKRNMLNAWNWDNYFNSWAMGLRRPELAWDMYQLHFNHQNEEGALGDGINEMKLGFTYTKPPVHGIVLNNLMHYGAVGDAALRRIYPKLVQATNWWFQYRDDDGDMICQYHHGNDSGWDDASLFDLEPPIESPDLSALLVTQLRVLEKAARRLGLPGDARDHRDTAERLLETLLRHNVRDYRFTAPQDGTHTTGPLSSLLLRVPVVLGRLLPVEVLDALCADLNDGKQFLGAHGLATESMSSPEFIPDGYWRGPAWAPATMLIIYGLIDAGRTELAEKLARRFCDTCRKSGFAECFNPITGEPLHDRGYTWTASVFIILAHWLETGEGIVEI